MNATERGDDMSLAVLLAALDWAADYSDNITIGGGEPTLHPKFAEFLGWIVLKHRGEFPPFIVTNGSNKELTLDLIHTTAVNAEVSLDPWHDPIDWEVEELVQRKKIARDTSRSISATGRAKDWGEKHCCCDDYIVDPRGDVWHCGCRKQKVGNVLTDKIPWRENGCEGIEV